MGVKRCTYRESLTITAFRSEYTGVPGKVVRHSDASSIQRKINMASCSQIRAGTGRFVLFKYLFPMALQSGRKDEVFWEEGRKRGVPEAGALHVVVFLVPGALLLTGSAGGWGTSCGCFPGTWCPPAHSSSQSCSHPGICHCHFTSAWHCSGNRMCKAGLLESHFHGGEGCVVRGLQTQPRAYVSYDGSQQES